MFNCHPPLRACARPALLLILIMAAVIAGAALGRTLLPPGSLGPSLGIDVPVARVEARPALRASSLPAAPVAEFQSGNALPHDDPGARPPRPAPAGGGPGIWLHQRDLDAERHAWQVELQVSLTWNYAGGEASRAWRNPTSAADGHPR